MSGIPNANDATKACGKITVTFDATDYTDTDVQNLSLVINSLLRGHRQWSSEEDIISWLYRFSKKHDFPWMQIAASLSPVYERRFRSIPIPGEKEFVLAGRFYASEELTADFIVDGNGKIKESRDRIPNDDSCTELLDSRES